MAWTPTPFNLIAGNPFTYSEHTITTTSATEAFQTGIEKRDAQRCVVCGISNRRILKQAHIIPQDEEDTWETMKQHGFVPQTARGVAHEVRNGILLCPNHHVLYNTFCYYVRWVPEESRFVFINHSRSKTRSLESYHGKAINLHVGDGRLPFHGAFLFHEMRVRGFWPLCGDRAISTPIPWADWIDGDGDNDGDDDGRPSRGRGGRGRGGRRGTGHNQGRGNRNDSGPSGVTSGDGGYHLRSHGQVPSSSAPGKVFIPTNPFADPATLQTLKDSFAKQPNWKASVMEGTTWEGNADENAAKWRRLNRVDG